MEQMFSRNGGGKRLGKFLAALLIFSFSFIAPLSVFADDVPPVDMGSSSSSDTTPAPTSSDTSTTPPLDTSTIESSLPTDSSTPSDTDTSSQTTDTTDSTPTDEDSIPTDGITPQPDSLTADNIFRDDSRDVVNSLRIQTDTLTGSMHYEFPLRLPPGRNNLTPDLKLVYSSQPSENVNLYGYGWTDSIPYIVRINRKGSDRLYTENFFYSSMDGELKGNDTATTTESYGAKIDNGSFLKYQYVNNNKWLVTDKNGTTYKFGYSTSTQEYDTASSTRIYKWMLEEVRDTNDNYIKYSYFHDANQIYPDKITYTGNGSTDGVFEIDFLRENRTDKATSTAPYFSVGSNYRIYEVQAKINGIWSTKYDLASSTGANGRRTLLSSITQSGQDESSNITTLPATTFSYQTSTKGFSNGEITAPAPFATAARNDSGTRAIDVDGDGLIDIMASGPIGTTTQNRTWIRTSTGWTEVSAWQQPDSNLIIDSSFRDMGIRLADVNGDGLIDVLEAEGNSHTGRAWINNGNGWTSDSTWIPPQAFTDVSSGDQGVRIVDVNGDGLPDILQANSNTSNFATDTVAFINNGHGWTSDDTWASPVPFKTTNGDAGTRMADVNGDGLVDILFWREFSGFAESRTYINNGHGWTYDPTWNMPANFYFANVNGQDRGVRLADYNGDGLVDVALVSSALPSVSGQTFINNGSGWTHDSGWDFSLNFTDSDYRDNGVRIFDIDGDGMDDLVNERESNADVAYLNTSKRPDMLITINSSQGATTTINYKAASLYSSGGTLLNPHIRQNYDTVQSISVNDGVSTTTTNNYVYEGGDYYYNGAYDRRPAGFQKITKIDTASTSIKTFYHQGNSTDSTNGESTDSWSKIGKPYRVEIADSSGNTYLKSINNWATSSLSNGREFAQLTRKTELTYDGNSDHKDKAEEYTYSTSTGNLTQKTTWGEVTASNDGTFSDTGTDKFTTTISYAASTTPYIVGLPSQQTVVDQNSNKVQESKYYYDTLAQNSVNKGNLTKEEKWATSSTYINTQKAYNSYGLVTQDTDPRGKITSYTFDTYNLYVATSTNPLSQTTAYQYDYSLGKPKQITDANNRIFQTIYDGVDRVTQEKQPDFVTPTTLVTKTLYTYTDTGMPRTIQKTNYLDSSTSTNSYIYVDGLGRTVQERNPAEAANTYAVKDTIYDSRGLKQKETLPYFNTGSSWTSPIASSTIYISYAYDPLQRVTSTTNSLGSTVNTYNDWKMTVTDALGKYKDLYSDAYGNLIKVDEHNATSTYTTQYQYNGLNNLTKITDALSNVRNFNYDGLGRRLMAEDLHTTADTIFGSTTFAYDDAGNLTQKLDAKNQTVNYAYDDINRVLTEDYTGSAGTEISYGYDSCSNGVGRLCIATTTDAISSYTYNPIGLTATEAKKLNSVTYTTQNSYDRQGNITAIVYPDNAQVTYTYNAAGLPETVYRKESSDAGFSPVVTNFDYSPQGQVATINYANGVQTTNNYDPTRLYRLTSKLTTVSGTSTELQNIAYTYDAVGNITKLINDSDVGDIYTVNYTYDDLYRLTEASSTSAGTLTGGTTSTSTSEYKMPILVRPATSTLTNFPVYLNLANASTTFWNHVAKSDGGDIRVYQDDGLTQVPVQIVSFSTSTATGELYFKAPALSTATSTLFYLDYGSTTLSLPASTTTYGAQNVWNNYKGVWHMNETSGTRADATSNTNNLANTNGVSYGTGKAGNAGDFEASNSQYLSRTDATQTGLDFTGGDLTFSMFIKFESHFPNDNDIFLTKRAASGNQRSYTFYYDVETDKLHFDSFYNGANTGCDVGSVWTPSLGTWYQVAATKSGTSVKLYVNGVQIGSTGTCTNGTIYDGTAPFEVGTISHLNIYYDGLMDEVRVASSSLSSDWIAADNMNLSSPSSFSTFGGEQSIVGTTTTAGTTTPGSAVYDETYTYDALGNILSKSGQGNYAYSGIYYTNPHAVTTIGSTGYAYDKNGNLASTTAGLTNTWNYRDQLTQSILSGTTTTYGYDENGQRVKYSNGVTTTYYPSQLYNVAGATTTKYIMANSQMVANLEGSNASTTVYYVHTDHLTGSNVITNASSTVVENLDYYPYGEIRKDTKATAFNEAKKFAGSVYDSDTLMNYMGARYYNSPIGRFTSQDQAFLALGDDQKLKQITKLDLSKYLADPQSMNSYSYVRNNPLKLIDPAGTWFTEVLSGQQSFSSFGQEFNNATYQLSQNSKIWSYAFDNPGKVGAVTGLVGGAAFLTGAPAVQAFMAANVYVPGVGSTLVANRLIEGSIYTYLTYETLKGLPGRIQSASEVKSSDPKSYGKFIGNFLLDYVPNFSGETIDAVSSVFQFTKSVVDKSAGAIQQQINKNDTINGNKSGGGIKRK